MQAAKRRETGAPGGPSAPPGEGKPSRRIGRGAPGRRPPARSGPRSKIAPPASLPSPGLRSLRRKETESKMVPRSGHTMMALVDSIQQSYQIQPEMLNDLNTGALLQTPAAEDMDVTCSVGQVQPDLVRSLEMTVVEKHLPSGYEQGSAAQTQTLRDFEKHLNDLKKENFSLKLRIYFLEERIQQKYEAGKEDIYSRNIELKVEVESLKRELQEKQENLDKAWAAVENSHSQNEAELCQQRKNKHVCEILEKKTQLLQEEVQSANANAERMTTLAETEKKRCLELSKQLIEFSKKQNETQKSQEMCRVKLAEKDKRIEELTQNLRDTEQLLELLSTEKQDWQQCLEEPRQMKAQVMMHPTFLLL